MSMSDCVEFGWLITDKGRDDVRDPLAIFEQLGKHIPNANDYGYELATTANHPEAFDTDALEVETHSEILERVFIRFCDVDHGDELIPEPSNLGNLVRSELARMVPNFENLYSVRWAVIITRR